MIASFIFTARSYAERCRRYRNIILSVTRRYCVKKNKRRMMPSLHWVAHWLSKYSQLARDHP